MKKDFSAEFFEQFKENSVALRLLRAGNFPLIVSFFFYAFLRKNRRSVPYQELIAILDHQLSDLAETYGESKYSKSAQAYIDDWIQPKQGYLRKYLPQNSDEPECDLVPDVEKALRWLEELQGREFVGTESRLKLLINLISELVQGTSGDKEQQLAALHQQKAQIEQQIVAIEQGTAIGLGDTEVKERLHLLSDISRKLLGDFRQVEANFRGLDKSTRQKITLGGAQKGKVLDVVFGDQDVINSSDEGKSFTAFFELLMTSEMRNTLRFNLKELMQNEQGQEFVNNDQLLLHLYSYLLEAGEKVNHTKQQITEQLRRYIEEQSQDNRRILELIRDFEAQALRNKSQETSQQNRNLDKQPFAWVDGFKAEIDPLFSRQLYRPKEKEQLQTQVPAEEGKPDVDLTHLFEVSHIDEFQLQQQILACLDKHQGQVPLSKVIAENPIQYGLDEVLTYVKLACEGDIPAHIDQTQKQELLWQGEPGVQRRLSIPAITFVREV